MATNRTAAVTRAPLRALVVSMRPRQWVKNLLVVAAPLGAGALFDLAVLRATTLAFLAFCLAASSVYLFNDVRDADADRRHPTKRYRPTASGELAPGVALGAAGVLAFGAVAVAAWTGVGLLVVVGAYLVASLAYTLGLKNQPVLDLALVAAGFVLRAVAGGVAAGLLLSQWFLLAAGFGSLFVVAGKRDSELRAAGEEASASRVSLGSYTVGYLRFVWTMAATITIATYALWAFEMQAAFARPVLAQFSVVPFVLALLRYGVDVDQGVAGEPETIVLGDPILLVLGLIWLALFVVGAVGV